MSQALFDHIVLKGWKAIARYLGRSVSTVKRYHKIHSLPVRIYPSGRVFAFKSQIDDYFLIYQELTEKKRKLHKTHHIKKARAL